MINSKHIRERIAYVIPSCDQYVDLWPVLFGSLAKFWPANSFRKYLITNHLVPLIEDVKILAIGDDVSWSDNLSNCLAKIGEDYIFLHIEDLIVCDYVDDDKLCSIINKFILRGGNYLRLNPTPRGVNVEGELDIVPVGDIYRASTVFSIWRKDVLRSVLLPGESAWAFEIYGSSRTDCFDEWFAAKEYLLSYVNLVIKGKIDSRALATLNERGVTYSAERPILTKLETLKLVAREKRSAVFELLPRRLKRVIWQVFKSA